MPANEIERLKALRDLAVLDTAAEEAFDELTRAAALVCEVPIALISLIDADRQWFKSKVGLSAQQTPRDLAFCAHAILHPEKLLEVADATLDPRFQLNPLVTGDPNIRFYAGASLVDPAGHALGTLCIIDRRARELTPVQREVLALLARQVMRLLEARGAVGRLFAPVAVVPSNEPLRSLIKEVPTGAVLVGEDGRLEINAAACAITAYRPEDLPDLATWFVRLFGAQHAQARCAYEQDRGVGFPQPRVVAILGGDGRHRQVEFHGVRSQRGEMWLLRDITATSGAEERFRVLFEQSSDAHLLFDGDGIIDCNHAAITMLGCSDKRQVLGLHPATLSPEFQPDGRRSDEKCVEMDALARERGYHRFDWMHRRADGSDFPAEVTLTPVQLSGHAVLLVVWHDLSERQKAEERERQLQRRWLLALEASGDGVWDWDLTTDEMFFSPRWKSMLGYGADEIGHTLDEWLRRVHPEDRARTDNDVRRHLQGEAAQYVNEHRVLCRDGTWKWVLDRGMVVERHADGRPRRMIGTYADLTERRQMEQRLRLDEERFRAISDVSPMGIYVTDVDGNATYLNERWCELAGMSVAAALGSGWVTCLHPDDSSRTSAAWIKSVADGQRFSHQYRYRHANGRVVWIQGDAVPMYVAGRVSGYVGVVTDITEQHDLELRLRDSIKRFDLVVAGASMGIWETAFDPECWQSQIGPDLPFYWSARLVEIMGYTPAEFAPNLRPWLEAMHPDDLTRTLGAVHDYLANNVPYRIEYRLRHRSGEYRWYYATGEAQRDQQGRPLRFAGSMADITVRKNDEAMLERARDEAEAATRAKADFLAMMSHELRTPMNGVIGMAELLLGTPLNPQQREFIETVRSCGDQLLALINDILDFSKIEAGQLILETIPFSVRRLAEDAVALLAEQAERKRLDLVCLIGADIPARLLGDPTRLRQVVLNLLGNAIKFTERGEVVLSLTRGGGGGGGGGAGTVTLDLAVRDTGIGISAEARARLFRPFSQADSSTTRKYGGTGLGLVICQRLISLMGGTIEIESEPARGSLFTCRVTLGIAKDSQPEPLPEALLGRHVLVIAESAAARRSLREQAIGWGMTCAEAANPAEITAALTAGRPAVVVIDHDLPGGGLQCASQVRQNRTLDGVPLVLIAGSAHRGMANTAKEIGIAGFLTKPVRHAHLFECLLVVLNQSKRQTERHLIAPAPAPALVTRHTLAEEREQRRVLVVEDNAVNRKVAVMMLAKLGCRCDIAVDGKEAVEALTQQDYHLVFMDCQMPVMDGFAATLEIRRCEGDRRHTRIVAVTANAMAGDRERCLAAGMDDYVSKPIRFTDLEAALTRSDQRPDVAAPAHQDLTVTEVDAEALTGLIAATDRETVKAVVELFKTEVPQALSDLQAALRASDAVTLSRIAHRLKGSSGTLGLRRVQALCTELEHDTRAKRLDDAGARVDALAQALRSALPLLAAHPLVKG